MERKTMGAFITVLRKSLGMTQKDLAERLNVSDKTVSHWERDENSPDISMVPVIAEVFGVTCDELLRGERINQNSGTDSNVITANGEKQIKYLMKKSLNSFTQLSMISVGVSFVGLIAALITIYLKPTNYLAFFVGIIFYIISVVLSTIFYLRFNASISSDELGEDIVNEYKLNGNKIFMRTIFFNIIIICFTVPLASVWQPFSDQVEAMFIQGGVYSALALVCYFVISLVLKKYGYLPVKVRTKAEKKLIKLRIVSIIATAALIAAPFALLNYYDNMEIKPIVFYDKDEFKVYMETKKDRPKYADSIDSGYVVRASSEYNDETDSMSEVGIYGEYSYEIESVREVVQFEWLNKEVCYFMWGADDEIYVYTYKEMKKRQSSGPKYDQIGMMLYAYVPLVIIASASVYIILSHKIRRKG